MTQICLCPECGAAKGERSCRERLDDALFALAPESPGRALAIACFALQHPRGRPAEQLAWARFHLDGCIGGGGAVALRARARRRVNAMSLPASEGHASWRLTLPDMLALPGDVEQRVVLWARVTRDDLASPP